MYNKIIKRIDILEWNYYGIIMELL